MSGRQNSPTRPPSPIPGKRARSDLDARPDFNARAAFDEGLARHRAGDLAGAAALYGQVLAVAPNHAETLHLLGLTRARSGDPEEAVHLIERAIALRPGFVTAYYNLGNVHREAGQHEAAVDAYRKALEGEPGHVEAWTNLGASLRALGRTDAAIEACHRAIALQPDNAAVHYNLGCAVHHAGRLDEAVAAYGRAVALSPGHADAQGNLGAALLALGRPQEALAPLREAARLAPTSDAQTALSAALLAVGAVEAATRAAREAIRHDPHDDAAWLQLAHCEREGGRMAEAISACRQAMALAPGSERVLVGLAIALEEDGQAGEARATVEAALAKDPTCAAAWAVLGRLRRFAAGDPEIARLESLAAGLAARSDGLDDLVHVEFTLAKALMDAGDTDRAFAALTRANRRHRDRIGYDVARDVAAFEEIARALDASRMAQLGGRGHRGARPIFVVGMPRSGTTLVEQILAAHPAIHGGGELKTLDLVITEYFGRHFADPGAPDEWADRLRGLGAADLTTLGAAYHAGTRGLAPQAQRITDKMPSNFRHVGLIHLILPDALVIHCQRAPLDTCLSCYATHFAQGQDFTYDLGELGAYYRAYRGLMKHWRRVVPPESLLDVAYEDVVADLDGQARRLIAACGLPWDDACLDFHRVSRQVRTASVNQVRQPIYATSIARWKAYEPHLRPLRL